ncbi:MAG: hypothetical protein LUF25_06165 [Phascolarctobacterium sp.]|nr:hypothetical protein [Phascolarctobacterium sp.]
MKPLCFASHTRILLYKTPKNLTNKLFCSLLLEVFDEYYDLRGSDDTTSKLLNGRQNIPSHIKECANDIDQNIVEQYFEKEIIPRININKKHISF